MFYKAKNKKQSHDDDIHVADYFFDTKNHHDSSDYTKDDAINDPENSTTAMIVDDAAHELEVCSTDKFHKFKTKRMQ